MFYNNDSDFNHNVIAEEMQQLITAVEIIFWLQQN